MSLSNRPRRYRRTHGAVAGGPHIVGGGPPGNRVAKRDPAHVPGSLVRPSEKRERLSGLWRAPVLQCLPAAKGRWEGIAEQKRLRVLRLDLLFPINSAQLALSRHPHRESRQAGGTVREPKKKPWAQPELVVLGDVRELTLAKNKHYGTSDGYLFENAPISG